MITSKAADEAGAGCRHGEKPGERERVAGRQKTGTASHKEWGAVRGPARPLEWRKTLWGIAMEWEGESSLQGASTSPEWKSCPGGTIPPE